ncbi:MAG: hypothetical protein AAF682_17935 [Planctomycetota bacterium]
MATKNELMECAWQDLLREALQDDGIHRVFRAYVLSRESLFKALEEFSCGKGRPIGFANGPGTEVVMASMNAAKESGDPKTAAEIAGWLQSEYQMTLHVVQ